MHVHTGQYDDDADDDDDDLRSTKTIYTQYTGCVGIVQGRISQTDAKKIYSISDFRVKFRF